MKNDHLIPHHRVHPKAFNSFLPKETMDMLNHYVGELPQDLAFEQTMSILFSDMRGFTALSEQYNPHKVYETINANLALQSKVIAEFDGSINKFLGDGLLACFSGEDRSLRAFKCVQKLLVDLKT